VCRPTMTNHNIILLSLIFSALALGLNAAFAPATHLTFQSARLIQGSGAYKKQLILHMVQDNNIVPKTAEVDSRVGSAPVEQAKDVVFYDDEVGGSKIRVSTGSEL
jgi:hypothetical protein